MFRVIQVGLGAMAGPWIEAIRAVLGVELAALVEINPAAAARLVEQYGLQSAPVFAAVREALDTVPADAVINVTPPAAHREVALAAIERGLHVLTEKPLADSMEAAREMVRRAEEAGRVLMVAQDYRYHPPCWTVKRLLQSGELGPVASITVEFFRGPHIDRFHDQLPHPLLQDMSIHHFDLMRFFLDADPVSITARSWNPPWSWFKGSASAFALIEFPGPVMVTYAASWVATGQEQPWNAHWRFECQDGVIMLRSDRVTVHRRTDEIEDLIHYRHYVNEPPRRIRLARTAFRSPQAYLLDEFVRSVTQGTAPATSGRDNLRSLGMVFDAIRSSETGQVVRSQAHG